MKVYRHTVTIDVKGFHNTVPIYRVALAPEAQRTSAAPTQGRSPAKIDGQPLVSDKKNSSEYAVDEIVAHRKENRRNLYEVHWYVYTPEYDPWRPASHLL